MNIFVVIQSYFHFVENTFITYGIDPKIGIGIVVVSVLLILLAFVAGRKYSNPHLVEPQKSVSFSNLVVLGVEMLYNTTFVNIGVWAKKIFWLVGGFFIFILGCNLMGLLPGFVPPTESFSVTFSLGIISFLAYNVIGIRVHKFGYVKQFLGPVIYLVPLFAAIELISHLVRPMTLGLRLFGNITGDHFVFNVFSERIFPVLIPVPFMFLGIFIALVQAFVFFQLSLVYISGASSKAH